MHNTERLANWAKGKVWGYFINPVTKETTKPFEIHNIISYTGADIMARLVGGDVSYFPQYVGFIYGTKAAPGITEPITSRIQTWTDLGTELAPVAKANVLITPFASTPTYSVDTTITTPGIYNGNAVTVSAHTGSRLEYGFTAGATYDSPIADLSYLYHCMLITRLVSGSTITYLPYARMTLKVGASYPQKPVGMELAIFWTISFA